MLDNGHKFTNAELRNLKSFDKNSDLKLMFFNNIRVLLLALQSHSFNSYEIYLIRNIHNSNYGKQQCYDYLIEYYKFLISLNIPSCIKGMSDADFINDQSHSHDMENKFTNLYKRTYENTSIFERLQTQQSFLKSLRIIKSKI